jgi:hypothetical protein
MGGAALLSYDVFHQICGPNALSRVVMATTQWGTVSANPEAGQAREADLTTFWAEILKSGACYMRIQPPESNVNDIIEYILTKQFSVATDVQKGMVDMDRRVKRTKVGQKLTDFLEKRYGAFATPRPPIPANAPPLKRPANSRTGTRQWKREINPEVDAFLSNPQPGDVIIVSVHISFPDGSF